MATFILIHGGNMSTDSWNRLTNRNTYPPGGMLGAKIWNGTAAYPEAHGHQVFAPTLKEEHTHDLTYHIEQVFSLFKNPDLSRVLLVGHSYGGMVITGLVARMPKRIRGLVYVYAALPEPGRSLFDLLAEGNVKPSLVSRTGRVPAYVEKLQVDPRKIRRLKKTYVLCTESEFAVVTKVAKKKIAANCEGRIYLELPASHVPMATMPGRLNQLLIRIANQQENLSGITVAGTYRGN